MSQQELNVEFTRRSDHEDVSDSKLDHLFNHDRLGASCSSTWEGAPGDHCWITFDISFRLSWRRQTPRRWLCDWEAFEQDVQQNVPSAFLNWPSAEGWLTNMVQKHSTRSGRRERRRDWEPFLIKELRIKIRISTTEAERNELSKQLFVARKRWFKERESVNFKTLVAKGRTPNRPSKLFTVTRLVEHDGAVARSANELSFFGSHPPKNDNVV